LLSRPLGVFAQDPRMFAMLWAVHVYASSRQTTNINEKHQRALQRAGALMTLHSTPRLE